LVSKNKSVTMHGNMNVKLYIKYLVGNRNGNRKNKSLYVQWKIFQP
jgi:hypothetical protein